MRVMHDRASAGASAALERCRTNEGRSLGLVKLRPTNDSPAVSADGRSVEPARLAVQLHFGDVVHADDAPALRLLIAVVSPP